MAIQTIANRTGSTGGAGLRARQALVNTGVVAPSPFVAPQMPPPPTASRTTGGSAPVRTLSPNEVAFDSFGNIAAVGGKNPGPTAQPTATRVTGGTAPVGSAAVITGTAPPPAPQMPPPPGYQPPAGQVTGGTAPVATTPFPVTTPPPQQAYPAGMDPGSVVSDFMTGLLDENGAYIQNARRRGLETAGQRGLLNSSIAAGASQRSALEAAQPLVNQMVGIQQDRESRAFTGEQNQLDRNQQLTMSQVQNWLNNETFNREFNGALSMLPITSAANLMQTIQQYALDNPEVYTPDVINGFANFFQNNFATMLQDYFPQYYGTGG